MIFALFSFHFQLSAVILWPPLCDMSLSPCLVPPRKGHRKRSRVNKRCGGPRFDFGGVLTMWLKNSLGTMEMEVMDDDVLKFLRMKVRV